MIFSLKFQRRGMRQFVQRAQERAAFLRRVLEWFSPLKRLPEGFLKRSIRQFDSPCRTAFNRCSKSEAETSVIINRLLRLVSPLMSAI